MRRPVTTLILVVASLLAGVREDVRGHLTFLAPPQLPSSIHVDYLSCSTPIAFLDARQLPSLIHVK